MTVVWVMYQNCQNIKDIGIGTTKYTYNKKWSGQTMAQAEYMVKLTELHACTYLVSEPAFFVEHSGNDCVASPLS